MTGHDLVQAARRLDASARHHKREADRHRKAAVSDRQRQAEIERQCAALGITVTYEKSSIPRAPAQADRLGATGEGNDPWPQNPSSTSRP